MRKNISILSEKNIKNGKLIALIPEFYDLKNVIEDNDWHNTENVFDHTLSVLRNLEKLFSTFGNKTKYLFDDIIDNNTRKDLLKVAIVFHDIAKKETIIVVNGSTDCPDHEKEGSQKLGAILKRFDLSIKESKIIIDMVKYHGLLHKMISPDNKNINEEFADFRKKFFATIYPELILLAYTDFIGSYCKITRSLMYEFIMDFYKREVDKLGKTNE